MTRKMITPFILAAPIIAAGCATGPNRVGEQTPTVSYSYETAREAEEAELEAEEYCFDNYGRTAVVIDDRPSGDERIITFECVPDS